MNRYIQDMSGRIMTGQDMSRREQDGMGQERLGHVKQNQKFKISFAFTTLFAFVLIYLTLFSFD